MPLHPPFPQASLAFVGRAEELGRVGALIASEVLFLVYGIAGIGKTELVYKLFDEARRTPRFAAATPVLMQARAGQRTEHLLSILRFRLQDKRGRPATCDTAPSFEEDLEEVTRQLEARPFLVFIDDVHHLDASAATVLGHLARHVRASRIFAASRAELLIGEDAPAPVVVRLGALDASSTGALVAALALRMDVAVDDCEQLFRRSGGSPFLVRRELARLRYLPDQTEERHDWTLSQLSREARRALLLGRALRGRLTIAELEQLGFAKSVVWELARHFLIDVERGTITVHDLIWEALRTLLSDEDVNQGRREGAELLMRRFEENPARNAADCVEALQLWIRAGEHDRAFAALHESYRAIAAAALDHLLLEVLTTLRQHSPERRMAADLIAVRIHLRRSHVADAEALLRALASDPAAAKSARYLRLSGEVCQRLGKLPEARALFGRAEAAAECARDRFATRLQLANAESLGGDSERARAVLAQARRDLDTVKSVDAARWAWSLALSFLVEDRLQEAVDAAAETAAMLTDRGPLDADALTLLGMHEIIGRVELDDVAAARALLDRSMHEATLAGALREQISAAYRGAVLFAEGNLPSARTLLEEALTRLERHQDFAPAAMAGYYLVRAQLGLGELSAALAGAERTRLASQAAGVERFVAGAALLAAEALLASGQAAAARTAALALTRQATLSPRSRAEAHRIVARAAALHRDAAGVREAMAAAAELSTAYPAARAQHDLQRAELVVWFGAGDFATNGAEPDSVDETIAAAERARAHFHERGRRYDEARALTTLAGALLLRADASDVARADALVGRAEELAARHACGLVHLRAVLLDAALCHRRGDPRRADKQLADALKEMPAAEDALEARLLRAAAAAEAACDALPALALVLKRLGLRESERYTIIGRAGTRSGDAAERQKALRAHELIIDVDRGTICRGGGGATLTGRPLLASLLFALLQASLRGTSDGISAELLFYQVWGGRQYDPLRHRNTIYVGITRLRQALRGLLPNRDVVETCADGWRIAAEVDLCAIQRETTAS